MIRSTERSLSGESGSIFLFFGRKSWCAKKVCFKKEICESVNKRNM